MKAVLFCGGMGMRMREFSESIPKPMVNIGSRPILWNLMKYYSCYGVTDFILCLGYQGEVIREYFLNYKEYLTNDFTIKSGGKELVLHNTDIHDWNITFVDTGAASNIGQRLLKVKSYLDGESMFLANYSDALSDLDLSDMISQFKLSNKIAAFMAYPSTQSFHVVKANENGSVSEISPISKSGYLINCGFFIFKLEFFDYINEGDELVEAPFQRLIAKQQLYAYTHNGFWTAMDTFKDKQAFDDLILRGVTPWRIWS